MEEFIPALGAFRVAPVPALGCFAFEQAVTFGTASRGPSGGEAPYRTHERRPARIIRPKTVRSGSAAQPQRVMRFGARLEIRRSARTPQIRGASIADLGPGGGPRGGWYPWGIQTYTASLSGLVCAAIRGDVVVHHPLPPGDAPAARLTPYAAVALPTPYRGALKDSRPSIGGSPAASAARRTPGKRRAAARRATGASRAGQGRARAAVGPAPKAR